MSRLKKRYQEEIRPAIKQHFNIANDMLIPGLRKVVINMGIAEASRDKNAMQALQEELALISGQKPIITKARKSIAGFKLREGHPLGLKVTLRGPRMWDFVYRFCNLVCPRIPDFRGFVAKTDGQGNFTLGLSDQQVFPEINLDNVKRTQGMHITFVTNTSDNEQAVELLRQLGVPFKNQKVVVAA